MLIPTLPSEAPMPGAYVRVTLADIGLSIARVDSLTGPSSVIVRNADADCPYALSRRQMAMLLRLLGEPVHDEVKLHQMHLPRGAVLFGESIVAEIP